MNSLKKKYFYLQLFCKLISDNFYDFLEKHPTFIQKSKFFQKIYDIFFHILIFFLYLHFEKNKRLKMNK